MTHSTDVHALDLSKYLSQEKLASLQATIDNFDYDDKEFGISFKNVQREIDLAVNNFNPDKDMENISKLSNELENDNLSISFD